VSGALAKRAYADDNSDAGAGRAWQRWVLTGAVVLERWQNRLRRKHLTRANPEWRKEFLRRQTAGPCEGG